MGCLPKDDAITLITTHDTMNQFGKAPILPNTVCRRCVPYMAQYVQGYNVHRHLCLSYERDNDVYTSEHDSWTQ